MEEKETLHFKIGLSGSSSKKQPESKSTTLQNGSWIMDSTRQPSPFLSLAH